VISISVRTVAQRAFPPLSVAKYLRNILRYTVRTPWNTTALPYIILVITPRLVYMRRGLLQLSFFNFHPIPTMLYKVRCKNEANAVHEYLLRNAHCSYLLEVNTTRDNNNTYNEYLIMWNSTTWTPDHLHLICLGYGGRLVDWRQIRLEDRVWEAVCRVVSLGITREQIDRQEGPNWRYSEEMKDDCSNCSESF
jgi:hypothetical protein